MKGRRRYETPTPTLGPSWLAPTPASSHAAPAWRCSSSRAVAGELRRGRESRADATKIERMSGPSANVLAAEDRGAGVVPDEPLPERQLSGTRLSARPDGMKG